MKKIFITAGVVMYCIVFGQVGIGNPQPHQNAMLEVFSESKGFLPPRLTTEQRDAIDPIPAGLTVYNTSLNCIQYWNTKKWRGLLKDDCTGTTAKTFEYTEETKKKIINSKNSKK
jgi:hypothetical protein